MTTKRKALANARNAKLSTGPRTAVGLERTSRNATKHAIYASTPVLPGVERQEEWTAHATATIDALAPATYLERALAERAALLLWRLGRVTRYEVHEASGAMAAVPDDVAERRRERLTYLRELVPVAIDQARANAATFRDSLRALERFAAAEADTPISDDDAREVFGLFLEESEDGAGERATSERPAAGWTAASVRAAINTHADEELCTDDVHKELHMARLRTNDASRKLAAIESEVSRMVTARMLPDGPTLEKVQRYEGHLERSLFRTLRELRDMQHGGGE